MSVCVLFVCFCVCLLCCVVLFCVCEMSWWPSEPLTQIEGYLFYVFWGKRGIMLH